MFHVKNLRRVALAEEPDAWATVATYYEFDVAANDLMRRRREDWAAYDPSTWRIEEWGDEGFVRDVLP
ncbi:MAG: hypothetical protein OSB10_09170 [Planctomycetota bacterium]|nr:hypothetical protein [Planctomycetota bacterium]